MSGCRCHHGCTPSGSFAGSHNASVPFVRTLARILILLQVRFCADQAAAAEASCAAEGSTSEDRDSQPRDSDRPGRQTALLFIDVQNYTVRPARAASSRDCPTRAGEAYRLLLRPAGQPCPAQHAAASGSLPGGGRRGDLHGDREPDRRRPRPQPRLQDLGHRRAERVLGCAGRRRHCARATTRSSSRRRSSSVFISTNIDYVLRNLGVRQLILCGVVTDQCVESAVRDACDLGLSGDPRPRRLRHLSRRNATTPR